MARKSKAHVASHAATTVITSEADISGSGQLSEYGDICQSALYSLNNLASCPDEIKVQLSRSLVDMFNLHQEAQSQKLAVNQVNKRLAVKLQVANEQLTLLRQEVFGPSSEKPSIEETDGFFDDDLSCLGVEADDPKDEMKKGKRKRLVPDNIQTQEVHHYPDNRTCCTCGCEMQSIRAERSSMIKIIPEHMVQIANIYHTCACNHVVCKDNAPVAAKAHRYIMRGTSLDLSVIQESAVQKFGEHQPTYRMEARMLHNGLNVSRQTIGRNLIKYGGFLAPLAKAIDAHIAQSVVVHMDETPLRVQSSGKGKCDIGYLWGVCADERRWNPEAAPAVCYHYASTRSGQVAQDILADGNVETLITDGYTGYNRLSNPDKINKPIKTARCWVHARRKFDEAVKAQQSPLGRYVVRLIGGLYVIEKEVAGLPPARRLIVRRAKSKPIVEQIKRELLRNAPDAIGKIGDAIKYTLKIFDELCCFLDDGRVELDNNPIERCMRPIALSKKNSFFAGSHDTAKTWAIFFTLFEICKLNKIDPRRYLAWVTAEIERTKGNMDHAQFLPWHCPQGSYARQGNCDRRTRSHSRSPKIACDLGAFRRSI